jgi:hypothetical protein
MFICLQQMLNKVTIVKFQCPVGVDKNQPVQLWHGLILVLYEVTLSTLSGFTIAFLLVVRKTGRWSVSGVPQITPVMYLRFARRFYIKTLILFH